MMSIDRSGTVKFRIKGGMNGNTKSQPKPKKVNIVEPTVTKEDRR